MACSTLQDNHYEAFLACSSEDEEAAKTLWNSLKEKMKITFHKDPHSPFFQVGQSCYENMFNAIENSDTTLVYLTEEALNSGYVCLEIMLALEKTQRIGKMCLHLIAENLNEDEINKLKHGLLARVPHILVDTTQQNWEDELVKKLKEETSLTEVLPVGNLAHGLVFNHYCGYLWHILPVLEAEFRKHQVFKENPGSTCLKYFMLIPFSCDSEASLEGSNTDSGVQIEHGGQLSIKTEYANKPRVYSPTIYKATSDGKSVYFIAEFPKALDCVHEIKTKNIADVDTRLEALRFFHTSNHLLNHRLNPSCNDKCVLLPYPDDKLSVQEKLWDAVNKELENAARTNPAEEHLVNTLAKLSTNEEETKYDVSVSCLSDVPHDREEAASIAKYLEDKGKSVVSREYKQGQLGELCDARRNIFVISHHSFKGNLNIELASAIFKCACNKCILMIPVVTGMKIDEVPDSLKWVTMLSADDKDFKEILLNRINGNVVHMQEKMPAGDVSTGLGWGYLLNYLPVQLGKTTEGGLDFEGRIKNLLRDKKQRNGCLPHFYIILPSDGKSVDQKEGPVSWIGKSEPIVVTQAGTKDREYYFHMYEYKFSDGKSVCYISEVCTPGYTLSTMAKDLQFAGIEEGASLTKQIHNLGSVIEGRLRENNYKEKVGDYTKYFRLISFDKSKAEKLDVVIGRHLKQDMNTSTLLYAEEPMET